MVNLQQTHFENRLTSEEVMGKSLVSCFFDSQCISFTSDIYKVCLNSSDMHEAFQAEIEVLTHESNATPRCLAVDPRQDWDQGVSANGVHSFPGWVLPEFWTGVQPTWQGCSKITSNVNGIKTDWATEKDNASYKLRLYVPHESKQVISETSFPANLLVWYCRHYTQYDIKTRWIQSNLSFS